MTMSNNTSNISHRTSSWARVASEHEGPHQSCDESWPVVKISAAPQTDPKHAKPGHLEDQLRSMEIELKQAHRDTMNHAAEKEVMIAQILKLESTLDHARQKIFRLQPPQDVSDEQVKQAFDDLCHNIEDFVDVECGELTDLEGRFNTESWTDLELRVTELHITEDDINISKEFPQIATNIIMNAIFSFVYDRALREDTWAAWTESGEQGALNRVVELMSKQKTFYDSSASANTQSALKFADNFQLRRWRSETIRALKSGVNSKAMREFGMKWPIKSLYFMLKHFADKGKVIKDDKLRSKLIEPAYHLADMIKGSTSGYRFDFVVNSSSHDAHIEATDIALHKLVNAHTGTEEEIVAEGQGRVGRLRLCIFPALEKVQEDGARVCMSKAFVVLEKMATLEEDLIAIAARNTESGDGNEATASASITPVKVATIEDAKHSYHENSATDENRVAQPANLPSPTTVEGDEWTWGSLAEQAGGTQPKIIW